jgi:hypothetical protein
MRRIGELLVAQGSLTEAAIARALHYQRMSGSGARLGTILLNWDLLAEQTLIEQLALLHRCDPVPWPLLSKAQPNVVKMLAAAAAIKLGAVPYAVEGSVVRVAFLNPSDLSAVDETAALLGKRMRAGVTSEVRLLQAHNKFYGRYVSQEMRSLIHRLQRKPASAAPSDRMRTAGEVVDFRAPDLVQWEGDAGAAASAADGAARDRTVVPIVSSEASSAPPPKKARGLPPPPDFYAPEPPPEFPMPPVPAVQPPAPREESLQEWVGEALGSFQRDALRGAESLPAGSGATPDTVTAGTPPPDNAATAVSAAEVSPPSAVSPEIEAPAAALGAEPPSPAAVESGSETPVNGIANGGHWRASRLDETDDAAVTGMWTGPEPAPRGPFREAHTREDVVVATIESLLPEMPRVLVLGASPTGIVSWYARVHDLVDPLPEVWLPPHERSIFSHVERTGSPHFGPLELELWPQGLAEVTGAKPPECAVFPVRVGDAIAAFLYADRLGQPMLYDDFGLLTRVAGALASSLSRLLLNSNSSASIQ